MLEVIYEWSFCSWAVRSKPTATDIAHALHSYLDPNRNSLQKPIGGRSVLTQKHANSMLKQRTYLKPNSQSMQKPIEGVYPMACGLFKGEGVYFRERNRKTLKTRHLKITEA